MTIGRERLRQILGMNGVAFQRTKRRKEPNDPDRDTKLDRIEHVVNEYRDRTFVFDEFAPLNIRPVQGSGWAHNSEIAAHFGPLREFVLSNSNHPNHVVLTRRLYAYLRWRNSNVRDLQVLEDQRRERRRVCSEKKLRWGRTNKKAA